MRNLDAGSFFVITGLTSHISLHNNLSRVPAGQSIYPCVKAWLAKRLIMMAALGFFFTLGSWCIFPERGAVRSDLLPYLLTFTFPFTQHFNQDRDNWHPNPPIWFIDICIWLWLLHPAVYIILKNARDLLISPKASADGVDEIEFLEGIATAPSSPEIDDTPIPRLPGQISTKPDVKASNWDLQIAIVTYLTLVGVLATFILVEKTNSRIHTGWSYHWLPRFLQYTFGVWSAHVALSSDIKFLIVDPQTWLTKQQTRSLPIRLISKSFALFCSQRIILRFMPDLLFATLLSIYSTPPFRYDTTWPIYWMPRSMAVTPIEALMIVSFLYSEYMAENEQIASESPKKNNTLEVGGELEEGELAHSGPSPSEEVTSAKSRVFAHFQKRVLRNYNCVTTSLWSAQWYNNVAPGFTNSVTYLAHFPLVWQRLYGKNEAMKGQKSLLFLLPLWWLALLMNKAANRVWVSITAVLLSE